LKDIQEGKELAGQRFAVIVDEAHSSQTGESTKSLKSVLAVASLEQAQEEQEEENKEQDLEDKIAEEMKNRGRLENVSFFAFTATPKPKTLELFGDRQPDGKFQAFSLYSMRQAIEERFILDVLDNYTTYKSYFSLLKKIETDPRYDRKKATFLLRSFVDLHEHSIRKKVEIMLEHFADKIMHRIGGKAKAMIVTRSRLHAVRYKIAVDAYLKERDYPFKALVAFSGSVKDPLDGVTYTESGMNTATAGRNVPENQTAKTFDTDEFRILIAANKFQTGFDQPLLHTMYVDKKLDGVNAVQTLSRLNRVRAGKDETMILDFVNSTDDIQKSFEPYYEKTILSQATDPNVLYDLQTRIDGFRFFASTEVESFAGVYYDSKSTQAKLHGLLAPAVDRYKAATKEERVDFRSALKDYIHLYAFLSQIITFTDVELEKLYVYLRLLLHKLPPDIERLPVEIQNNIDMDSYRIQHVSSGNIKLTRGSGELQPAGPKGPVTVPPEDLEALSRIIRELNERFGTEFTQDDRVFIEQFETKLAGDIALEASVRVNPKENVRLTFDVVANDRLQEMIESNFKFYKQVTDDVDFRKHFFDWLFERFYQLHLPRPAGAG
jgi:type I restriction enzyme R subunit